jgi:predicted nucleic acid-binding Zn ribbon protein
VKRPTPLSDALTEWIQQSGMAERLGRAGVLEEWPLLVGPQIARVTEPESVSADGLLRVRVATAAWAQELSLMTPRILARINAGRTGRITGIRWLAGGLKTRS